MNKHAHLHNNTGIAGALRLVPDYQNEAGVPTDAPPREVVEMCARQTADLSAMVAAAIREERVRHSAVLRSLRVVEAALVEHDSQLAALTARLGGGDQ